MTSKRRARVSDYSSTLLVAESAKEVLWAMQDERAEGSLSGRQPDQLLVELFLSWVDRKCLMPSLHECMRRDDGGPMTERIRTTRFTWSHRDAGTGASRPPALCRPS